MAEARWIVSPEHNAGTFTWTAEHGREAGVAVATLRFVDVPARLRPPGTELHSAVIAGLAMVSRDGEAIPSVRPFKWDAEKSLSRDLMSRIAGENPGSAMQAGCMAATLNCGASFQLVNAAARTDSSNAPESAMAKLEMFREWQRQGQVDTAEKSGADPSLKDPLREDRVTIQPEIVDTAIRLGIFTNQLKATKSVRLGLERDGFFIVNLLNPDEKVLSAGGLPKIFADAGVTEAAMPKELAGMMRRACEVDVAASRKALSAVAFATPRAVAWYGDSRAPSFPERQQAASSMPVLAGMIAASAAMSGAVDRRLPLQPLLIERTGLSKGGLKRLAKISEPLIHGVIFGDGPVRGQDALGVDRLRTISLRGRFSEEDACRMLAKLPPDWVPDDNQAWKAFRDVSSAMVVPLSQVLGADPDSMLKASRGKWADFRDGFARAADIAPEGFDRERIALSTIDAIQVVDELSRHIVLPLVLNTISGTGQPVSAALPGDLDLGRQAAWSLVVGNAKNQGSMLFEVARRWASRIPSLDAILRPGDAGVRSDEPVERTQPLICEPFHASNGRVIRNLHHADLLVEESARLGHCVGRFYLDKSHRGNCHLFSVQDETGGHSYSTVEFQPIEDTNLTTVQHRARNNADPEEADVLAVSEFISAVRSRAFAIDIQAATSWRDYVANTLPNGAAERPTETPRSSWNGALGCDRENEEMGRALWNEWKNILGDKWSAGETSGILFKSAPVRELVEAFSPAAAAILHRQQAERRAAAAQDLPAADGPTI